MYACVCVYVGMYPPPDYTVTCCVCARASVCTHLVPTEPGYGAGGGLGGMAGMAAAGLGGAVGAAGGVVGEPDSSTLGFLLGAADERTFFFKQ